MTAGKDQIPPTAVIAVDGIGSYEVMAGSNLRETLRREGVYIDGTCSDNGTCGRCVVKVIKGDAGIPSLQETALLNGRISDNSQRLACRIAVQGNLFISIDSARILEIDQTGRWKEVWDSPLWRPDLPVHDSKGYGVAVDLGTTSVASCLLDLTRNKLLDIRASANPQMPWGEEVISRLGAAAKDPQVAAELGDLAWGTIKAQVQSLCLRNGLSAGRIGSMVVVGNSAMHHLLLGFPPGSLLTPPYSPSHKSSMDMAQDGFTADLGLSRRATIYFPPLVGGYAGSDILVSVLAAKNKGIDKGALFDVGTNTEIAVWNQDRVIVATAPSGPAFEGGHISSGMRAEEGAVWKVEVEGNQVLYEVIGDGPPHGICGTGMIDILSVMLRNKMLDQKGLVKAGSHPVLNGTAFVISNMKGVALRNEDIATLQKAKSAISTTFQMILKKLGIPLDELESIYIAGAFGSRLSLKNAVEAGLLPRLPVRRFVLAGNAALVGASMMLVSSGMKLKAEQLSRNIEHLDVAASPEFEELFIENLYFPAE